MAKVVRNFLSDEVLNHNKGLSLLMFVILYTSFDTLIFGTLDIPIFRIIHDVGHILVCLYCMLKIAITRFSKTPIIILCLWIMISCIMNWDLSGGNFLLCIVLIISFYIANSIQLKIFLLVYEHLFFYIVFINLLLYGLYHLMPTIFEIFPLGTNIVSDNYRIAVLTVFPEGRWVNLRNMCFFREPGVYMMYLNFAIIINLFSYEKPNVRNLIVYIIAMITTLSTAGYVILLLLLFTYYGFKKSKQGVWIIIISGVLLLLSFAVIKELDIFLDTFGKFSSTSDKYVSTEARYASTTAPIDMIIDNPVLGTGMEQFSADFIKYSVKRYHHPYSRDGGATNTLLNLGAIYGIFLLFLMLRYLMKFVKMIQFKKNKTITSLLFLSFTLILSNEEVYHTVFFMTLLMYGATKQCPLQSYNNRVISNP